MQQQLRQQNTKNVSNMRTVYYIIEENEELTLAVNPLDMTVYAFNGREYRAGLLTKTNKKDAQQTAKLCGMKVAIIK